jgi:hypothetical protein
MSLLRERQVPKPTANERDKEERYEKAALKFEFLTTLQARLRDPLLGDLTFRFQLQERVRFSAPTYRHIKRENLLS